MIKILITGENSYIGNKFREFLSKWSSRYEVHEISVRDNSWKLVDFGVYDVVYHVAGIAHRKETESNKEEYYKINRDLTYEIAKKSKSEGVRQFIFLSSMSVYGNKKGMIDCDTRTVPTSAYGLSKLEAEKLIMSLSSDLFFVSILRPPMVYGPNCKGNYPRLSKFSQLTPIFPNYKNKRSMLYVDNLSIFVKNIIDFPKTEIICPQNKEIVCTSDMVLKIADIHGRKILAPRIFNKLISRLLNVSVFNKIFGDLYYRPVNFDLDLIDFEESLLETESINGR